VHDSIHFKVWKFQISKWRANIGHPVYRVLREQGFLWGAFTPLEKYFSSRRQGTYSHNKQPHVHLHTMGCPTSAVKNELTVGKAWSRYTEMTMEFPVSIFRKETVDKIVLEFGSVLPPPLRTSRGTRLLAKKIRSLSESV